MTNGVSARQPLGLTPLGQVVNAGDHAVLATAAGGAATLTG